MIKMESVPQLRQVVYLRDLLRELVARDMKIRYKRSFLGFAWSMLNPLAQLLVLGFVFHTVLPLNIPNYTAFLFIGLLVWSWFQSALLLATGAIVDNAELIRRPAFPSTILPVVSVTTHLVHFLLALPILLIFLAASGAPLTAALFMLPVVIALQYAFTLGIAYLVAKLYVSFRDTQYLLGIVLLLGFYLSPVFYSVDLIPAQYQMIYQLNPMMHLLGAYRDILLYGILPDFSELVVLSGMAAVSFCVGYVIFQRARPRFVQEL